MMGRFACSVPGCGRTFIRKEHLTRHAQTHGPVSYICPTCGRGFVRNDVLQNHIARHAEPERIPRGKRACDRCHANKTRCNGDSPCSSCKRRGVVCKDERGIQVGKSQHATGKENRRVRDQFQSDAGTESFDSAGVEEVAMLDEHNFQPDTFQGISSNSGMYAEDDAVNGATMLQTSDVEMSLKHAMPGVEMEQEQNILDTSTCRIAPNLDQNGYTPPSRSPHAVIYFNHFHHRWPILHAPTFDEENGPVMLTSSVIMIGHWLESTAECKAVALAIHDRVSRHLLSKMLQINPYASRMRMWPINLFEACLLHVIFALYTGKEEIMSQTIVMLGILISILREIGFFALETSSDQSWPGAFVVFRWVKKEARNRLAASLFKVDAYYSILRNKPPLLNSNEIVYSLPSTFALWNCGGLPVWEARNATEPREREMNTIRYILGKAYMDADPKDQIQKLLPEDIQLGLCSVQADMWRYSKPSFIPEDKSDHISLPSQKETQHRLDFWKTRLDRISISELAELGTSATSIHESFYHGLEDHTFPCWQKVVAARSSSIIAESRALYHLLNIQLYANTRIMRLSMHENGRSGEETIPICKELLERVTALRSWAQTWEARKALWHAMWILVHENNNSEFENREAWDPIVHVAASVAAMVVWIYATYACNDSIGHQCAEEISGNLGLDPVHARDRSGGAGELTMLSGTQLDVWLEKGGPVTIGAILVCQCTTTLLMATLNAHLPPDGNQGWIWD